MSSNSGGSAQGAGLFREIHKHAWLKRTHPAPDNNRLLLRSHKKPSVRSQWTLLCVHDGIAPYLEQYGGDVSEGSPPQPGSLTAQAVVSHRPTWRATLAHTRHVTPAIAPWEGSDEYEFVITTEETIIRLVAVNWEAMQDWVRTLRARLRELGALAAGENVYGAPPAAPALRAHTRDPNSPLPPTPPVPAIRVPGIEHATVSNRTTPTPQLTEITENIIRETVEPSNSTTRDIVNSNGEEISIATYSTEVSSTACGDDTNNGEISAQETETVSNISNNARSDSDVESESDFASLLLSQIARNSESNIIESNVAVAKVCGQNICFDDSVLKRNVRAETLGSDDEFFSEFDQISHPQEVTLSNNAKNANSLPLPNRGESSSVKVLCGNSLPNRGENLSVNVKNQGENLSDNVKNRGNNLSVNVKNRGENSSVNVKNRGENLSVNEKNRGENSSVNVESDNSLMIKKKNYGFSVKSDNFTPIKLNNLNCDVQSVDSLSDKKSENTCISVESDIVIIENVASSSGNSLHVRSDYTKVDLSKKANFKQRLLVSNVDGDESHSNAGQSTVSVLQRVAQSPDSEFSGENSLNQSSNVTVIQVSTNREPPHTAIPIMGPDVFNFNIPKRKLSNTVVDSRFINVINTENHRYGTIFANSKPTTSENSVFVTNSEGNVCRDEESPYGHISLTTTVKLTGKISSMTAVSESNHVKVDTKVELNDSNGIYERLSMASTSNLAKPLPKVRRKFLNLKSLDSNANPSESRRNGQENAAYEFLFMSRTNVNVKNEENRDANVTVVNNDDVTSRRPSRASNSARTDAQTSKNAENSMKQEIANAVSNKGQPVNRGLFRRGLTELSLFSKLRSLGGDKGGQSTSQGVQGGDNVIRRNRTQSRNQEGARRRSSSLSGETWEHIQLPSAAPPVLPAGSLGPNATLRVRQAQALWSEQARGTRAPPLRLRRLDAANVPIALVDAFGAVWVAGWVRRIAGAAHGVLHVGDRLLSVQGVRVADARQARSRIAHAANALHTHVELHFQRVPHARIYVVAKEQEQQGIGLVLDAEGEITEVEQDSPAARAGLPPDGVGWAVTEVNNRPINMLKGGGSQAWSRTCSRGKEISLLLQPAALVSRLRRALRSHRAPHAYLVE